MTFYVRLPTTNGVWHAPCVIFKDTGGERVVVRTFDGTLHIASRKDVIA